MFFSSNAESPHDSLWNVKVISSLSRCVSSTEFMYSFTFYSCIIAMCGFYSFFLHVCALVSLLKVNVNKIRSGAHNLCCNHFL